MSGRVVIVDFMEGVRRREGPGGGLAGSIDCSSILKVCNVIQCLWLPGGTNSSPGARRYGWAVARRVERAEEGQKEEATEERKWGRGACEAEMCSEIESKSNN